MAGLKGVQLSWVTSLVALLTQAKLKALKPTLVLPN